MLFVCHVTLVKKISREEFWERVKENPSLRDRYSLMVALTEEESREAIGFGGTYAENIFTEQ